MPKAPKYAGSGFYKSMRSVDCDICGASFNAKGIARHRSSCAAKYANLQAGHALQAAHQEAAVDQLRPAAAALMNSSDSESGEYYFIEDLLYDLIPPLAEGSVESIQAPISARSETESSDSIDSDSDISMSSATGNEPHGAS